MHDGRNAPAAGDPGGRERRNPGPWSLHADERNQKVAGGSNRKHIGAQLRKELKSLLREKRGLSERPNFSVQPAGVAMRTAPHVCDTVDTGDALEHGIVGPFTARADRGGHDSQGLCSEGLRSRHVPVIGLTSAKLQMSVRVASPLNLSGLRRTFMTRPADPTEPKSNRDTQAGASKKPSGEVGHERPTDDPGRGQGDVFDDKLPPESTTERPSR